MMYVDYILDMEPNALMLDSEFKLKEQVNENEWGNLPEEWKSGDMFQLTVGPSGKVSFVKVKE
jgi:hypothetical protein